MSALSNYLENALLNATLSATAYTSPSTVYLGLFLTDPTDANTGNEISGGSYMRAPLSFGTASNGQISNIAAINFEVATTDWGTVGWVGIFDAQTSGNLLFHTALNTPVTVSATTIFTMPVGSLVITLS